MPPEIEEVFGAFGIPLFPGASGDMHLMCSCPDWGEPCKHTAAVLLAGLRRHDAAQTTTAAHPPPMPPGLLLRLLDPPKVKIRRRDLPELLHPAYDALADL